MAKYLTSKLTQAALEKIIMSSEKQLILVSPYISLTNQMFARIKATAEKGVRVKVIYRLDKVTKEEIDRLRTIKNIELKCIPDLHAKCYFNEREMIITSLNLLDTSERNWEMGILISKSIDKEIFESAMNDVQTIYMDSAPISKVNSKTKTKEKYQGYIKTKTLNGFCIRCGKEITFNVMKPLCGVCYESWADWGNEDYPESYCHFSGEPSFGETYYAHPVLSNYWKEAKSIHKLPET